MQEIIDSTFDYNSFLKTDQHNRELSFKNLSDHWIYLGIASGFYSQLSKNLLGSQHANASVTARFHYLNKSCINLIKGISNLTSGHIIDSNLFVRRTIESIQCSIYFRENPDIADLWFKTNESSNRKEFDKGFKKWFSSTGKGFMLSELPYYSIYYGGVSNLGPHAHLTLISQQIRVTQTESGESLMRTLYHDIEPGLKGHHSLILHYFLHIDVHFSAINWWINNSQIDFNLSQEEKDGWAESYRIFQQDFKSIRDESKATGLFVVEFKTND